MSLQAIEQLLERALSEPAFRAQLKANLDEAIKGYDLTPDEIVALKKGDDATLRAMSVDEQLGKGGQGGAEVRGGCGVAGDAALHPTQVRFRLTFTH
jgi:hypothetical protein